MQTAKRCGACLLCCLMLLWAYPTAERVYTMEFNEKLQLLRKQHGLTQEELAEAIFVSRAAISKWESGRGYPTIDSLKALAAFFSVTVDSLLSDTELNINHDADHSRAGSPPPLLLFGLLDCTALMLLLLPLFSRSAGDMVQSVSLFTAADVQPYMLTAYCALIIVQSLLGVIALVLRRLQHSVWHKYVLPLSLVLSAAALFLFLISRQPYAGAFTFALLAIKCFLLFKSR